MKTLGFKVTTVKLFTTPDVLRMIADKMEKEAADKKIGDRTLVHAFWFDDDTNLEIHFNQARVVDGKFV